MTATGAPPATIPLRVAAAIAEEAKTRALEATILARSRPPRMAPFSSAAAKGIAGPTFTSDVQRDFFPGKDRLTYLEHFVLSERMLDAIKREKLKPKDIQRIDKEVDAIDLTLRPLDKNLTDPFPTLPRPGRPEWESGWRRFEQGAVQDHHDRLWQVPFLETRDGRALAGARDAARTNASPGRPGPRESRT